MSLSLVLFFVIAFATGFSALAVVFSRNIVRAAVWLLFTLIGVSLIYFLLGAEFLGASQLIIYVGGTLVLVVFGVMLTAQGPFLQLKTGTEEWVLGGFLALSLFGFLVNTSLELGKPESKANDPDKVSVGSIGSSFMGVKEATPPAKMTGFPEGRPAPERTRMGYLLPFEIVSVHLLVVLIGAAYLARAKRRRRGAEESRDTAIVPAKQA
ncbi:MAG: NADH-quinone oxidoreductase subunit J [Planctomycetes bacterium]|nr:NADH-quinone oxidoreductase subunit J [Planctomycetota bacterium]